jgi:hypothetical protein
MVLQYAMNQSSPSVGTQRNAVMIEARNVFRRWLAIFVPEAPVAFSNSRGRMIAAARALPRDRKSHDFQPTGGMDRNLKVGALEA